MLRISAIVPARNEERNIEAAVLSLAAQSEIAEIIVVDDQSADRTPQVLARLASSIQALRVLQSGELPRGWTGKNHALWLGAQKATCEWLLFTDADTVHLSGAARRALEDARTYAAALVSYSPEQRTETFFERALIPFIYCRLVHHFDFSRVNDPSLPDAAANGQFILVSREAYEDSGGHRAVAEVVLEDVALARRVKALGFRIYFASGGGIVRTRMYRSFPDLWQGWSKNLYALLGASLSSAAREIVAAFPWIFVILVLSGLFLAGKASAMFIFAGFLALLLQHVWYARELQANRYSLRFIIYYSAAALLYAALVVASAWNYRRGRVVWKGREYSIGGPKTEP